MNESWFVYICKSNTGRYYTGISNDPQRRLKDHNFRNGAQFARDQGPFTLVYVSSSFETKSAARKREIQIKGWRREKKENLIAGKWV